MLFQDNFRVKSEKTEASFQLVVTFDWPTTLLQFQKNREKIYEC